MALRCAVDQPNRWAFRCRANVNGERVAVRMSVSDINIDQYQHLNLLSDFSRHCPSIPIWVFVSSVPCWHSTCAAVDKSTCAAAFENTIVTV